MDYNRNPKKVITPNTRECVGKMMNIFALSNGEAIIRNGKIIMDGDAKKTKAQVKQMLMNGVSKIAVEEADKIQTSVVVDQLISSCEAKEAKEVKSTSKKAKKKERRKVKKEQKQAELR